jgi:hypothetical protein
MITPEGIELGIIQEERMIVEDRGEVDQMFMTNAE